MNSDWIYGFGAIVVIILAARYTSRKKQNEHHVIQINEGRLSTTVYSNSEWEQRNEWRNHLAKLYELNDWRSLIMMYESPEFQTYSYDDDLEIIAAAYFKQGNQEKAEELVNTFIEKAPYNKARACLNLAIHYRDAENLEKAIEWVLNSDPSKLRAEKNWSDFYRAMRIGGQSFMNLGKPEEAINFLRLAPTTARILDLDLAEVLYLLGDCYEATGQYEKALKCYQKFVTVKYDKAVNAKILEMNRLVYEQEVEKEERKALKGGQKKK